MYALRRLHILLPTLIGATVLIGGCGFSAKVAPVFKGAARAVLIGGEVDHSVPQAAKLQDKAAFKAACVRLRNGGATDVAVGLASRYDLGEAERIVREALASDYGPRGSPMRMQAAAKYRAALRADPAFDCEDPNRLNALGYFLAERGDNVADFELALVLTQRALDIFDDLVRDSKDSPELFHAARLQRENIRDSYAWALFRLKRYPEALEVQRKAVREATTAGVLSTPETAAELHYHLGEIYRAVGRYRAARRHYMMARQLNGSDSLSQRALDAVTPLVKNDNYQDSPEPLGPDE